MSYASPMTPADRPPAPPRALRADAQRNRQLIIDTARRAFAEQGLGVRLDEIAEQAGLGVGTVYRRFTEKDELVRVVFEQAIEKIVALADALLAEDTDGTALREFFEQTTELMSTDRGLQQILTGSSLASADLAKHGRAAIEPRVMQLAANARAHGRLRSDVSHHDLPIVQIMLTAAVEATTPIAPDLWRRYVGLVLDALTPSATDTVLPGEPPTSDQVYAVITNWRAQPRQPGALN
jgi:AcrR family transcriptional regulator